MTTSSCARALGPVAILITSGVLGCSGGDDPPTAPPQTPPHVMALSTYDAPVGRVVRMWGTHFADGRVGQMQLLFDGTFTADDGTKEPIHAMLDARYLDAGTLSWDTFGPYKNPLSATGDKTGTFDGTVAAQVVGNDGKVLVDPEPTVIKFHVQPSNPGARHAAHRRRLRRAGHARSRRICLPTRRRGDRLPSPRPSPTA